MRPAAPPDPLEAIERWAALPRWERTEVGRALRRLGWSYGEVREVIDVPKATFAEWCREIRLTDEQIAAIKVARRRQARRPARHAAQASRRDRAHPRRRTRRRTCASPRPAVRRRHRPLLGRGRDDPPTAVDHQCRPGRPATVHPLGPPVSPHGARHRPRAASVARHDGMDQRHRRPALKQTAMHRSATLFAGR